MAANLLAIKQYLASRAIGFVSDVKINDFSRTIFLEVPRDKLKSKADNGFTSNRQLHFLSRAIERKFDVRVFVAFRDTQQGVGIETGLSAGLARTFRNVFGNAFISHLMADRAFVWVETTVSVEEADVLGIKKYVEQFLAGMAIHCDGIEVIGPTNPEPSTAAILRSVKRLSPVKIEDLSADLRQRDFCCPSDRWLAGKLDGARKRGLTVRNIDGTYTLTAAGLGIVPHSRSRSSSDIERMLSLAKRRMW